MDPNLVIVIGSAVAGSVIFIIRTTGQILERFDKLQDRVTLEEVTRQNQDESIRKEVEYKLTILDQRHVMASEQISKSLAGLERTVKALHDRLDKILENYATNRGHHE